MQNVVFSMKEYGHVEIQLKEIMEKRGITRNALARATNKWYQGHVEKLDTDVLARICYILDCTPGDIVIYTVSKE